MYRGLWLTLTQYFMGTSSRKSLDKEEVVNLTRGKDQALTRHGSLQNLQHAYLFKNIPEIRDNFVYLNENEKNIFYEIQNSDEKLKKVSIEFHKCKPKVMNITKKHKLEKLTDLKNIGIENEL